jgi:hypothetical protein
MPSISILWKNFGDKMKRFLRLDWDAIAGIAAAVAALVMHFLHVLEADILLMLAVVLLALLFLRDLRRERHAERLDAHVAQTATAVKELQGALRPPDAILVGPRQLRAVTEGFASRAHGDMVWFHVCLLMFKPQSLFDTLLRPAIENPLVQSIQFVLDPEQGELWESAVLPKVQRCRGQDKVKVPCWTSIKENVSCIISDIGTQGRTECLVSFWGEPFMARTVARDVPRYIFHVQSHSELVGRLVDLVRSYRISA